VTDHNSSLLGAIDLLTFASLAFPSGSVLFALRVGYVSPSTITNAISGFGRPIRPVIHSLQYLVLPGHGTKYSSCHSNVAALLECKVKPSLACVLSGL